MDGLGVVIFSSRRAAECNERSLVLRAMGVEHIVRRQAGAWMLVVPERLAPGAVQQLDAYARENRGWPRRHRALPHHPLGLSGVAGCVLVLLAVAAADGHMLFGLDWFAAGRIDTDLVRQGEWWRTVTALTLHASVGHLVGNLLLGSVFGLIAGRLLGDGLAWFSIVMAGAVGNGLSALVQLPGHRAIGASTAVFAALGLIAAYVWRRRRSAPSRWTIRWAPIIVAIILLAWTGSGGARTDVVAHLTGFLAGIGFGVYYGSLSEDRPTPEKPSHEETSSGRPTPGLLLGARGQWLLGLGAVAIVAVAWAIALGSHG